MPFLDKLAVVVLTSHSTDMSAIDDDAGKYSEGHVHSCQRDKCQNPHSELIGCSSCSRAFCKPCWKKVQKMPPVMKKEKGLQNCSMGDSLRLAPDGDHPEESSQTSPEKQKEKSEGREGEPPSDNSAPFGVSSRLHRSNTQTIYLSSDDSDHETREHHQPLRASASKNLTSSPQRRLVSPLPDSPSQSSKRSFPDQLGESTTLGDQAAKRLKSSASHSENLKSFQWRPTPADDGNHEDIGPGRVINLGHAQQERHLQNTSTEDPKTWSPRQDERIKQAQKSFIASERMRTGVPQYLSTRQDLHGGIPVNEVTQTNNNHLNPAITKEIPSSDNGVTGKEAVVLNERTVANESTIHVQYDAERMNQPHAAPSKTPESNVGNGKIRDSLGDAWESVYHVRHHHSPKAHSRTSLPNHATTPGLQVKSYKPSAKHASRSRSIGRASSEKIISTLTPGPLTLTNNDSSTTLQNSNQGPGRPSTSDLQPHTSQTDPSQSIKQGLNNQTAASGPNPAGHKPGSIRPSSRYSSPRPQKSPHTSPLVSQGPSTAVSQTAKDTWHFLPEGPTPPQKSLPSSSLPPEIGVTGKDSDDKAMRRQALPPDQDARPKEFAPDPTARPISTTVELQNLPVNEDKSSTDLPCRLRSEGVRIPG